MWIYTKQLEYPVNIVNPNPRMAKMLLAQYGGPDSELAEACAILPSVSPCLTIAAAPRLTI